MDFQEIFNTIFKAMSNTPKYVWVILFFALVYIFRDRTRWEHEVDFPLIEGIGKIEVEIEHSKSSGTEIEVEMELEKPYQHKSIDILINNKLVCTVPETANNGSGTEYLVPYEFGRPNSGDLIKVVIDNKTIFSGKFK